MTASELLALLGQSWSRLLVYPGGLSAFAVAWLLARVARRAPTPADTGERLPLKLAISAVVLPWLGLALLPLPLATAISRRTDILVVLALLEWPLILTIALEFRARAPQPPAHLVQRLAAALNSYPPLILATLVLALAAGSFEIGALARPPDETTPVTVALQHWLGALAWTLALPPALAIGPFAARPAAHRALRTGLRLRVIGLVALAALPWFPWLGELGWLLPLPPLLIAALLWGYDRLTAGGSTRRWARAYLVFDAVLLLVLLWAAFAALQERLA